jgi:hypothetical protein
VKYKAGGIVSVNNPANPALQKWKLTHTGLAVIDKNLFIISSAAFPDKLLQPLNNTQTGVAVVLGDRAASTGVPGDANAWRVSSPLINDNNIVGNK